MGSMALESFGHALHAPSGAVMRIAGALPHGGGAALHAAHALHSHPGAPPQAAPPDYQSLLQADPNYMAWQTNSIHNLSDAATARKAAIRSYVEQYGGLPPGFVDKYGDLSSADISLAAQNPYSTEADLKRAYATNSLNMKKALAARGALHSGDLGYGQNQLDTSYGQQQYDAGQQFSSQLQDAINSYLGVTSQDRQDQTAAIQAAYGDIIGNPAYVPTGS